MRSEYEVEPLILPGTPPQPDQMSLPEPRALEPGSPEALFWYRWITGHQVTFIIWRLLAEAVSRSDREAASLVRGYTAMLLYTGSCTRSIYHGLIRPSMAARHPGFDGSWAPDYQAVRGVLCGHDGFRHALAEQQQLNSLVRLGITVKLVPSGRSLLKRFNQNGRPGAVGDTQAIFDSFFLTSRRPVSRDEVLGQLTLRANEIWWDLATNGLYPAFASSKMEKSALLHHPAVLACEREIPDLLFGW